MVEAGVARGWCAGTAGVEGVEGVAGVVEAAAAITGEVEALISNDSVVEAVEGTDWVEFAAAFVEGGMTIEAIETDASSLSLIFSMLLTWFENAKIAHSVNSFLKS